MEAPIESGKAQASFKNGILEVKIPKNKSAKAKETKILIKTA
jgi:HSP20 family molecular chaperone IbpA